MITYVSKKVSLDSIKYVVVLYHVIIIYKVFMKFTR